MSEESAVLALPPAKEIELVLEPQGLAVATITSLKESFVGFLEKAYAIQETAKLIQVTDETQTKEVAAARKARLALRTVRTDVDKMRKSLKEDSLRRGRAIDAVAKKITEFIEPAEAYLLEQEQYIERLEAARKAELKGRREIELKPFGVNPSFYNLLEMSDPEFNLLVESLKAQQASLKAQQAEQAEAARVAEEARVAKEKADAEEKERLRLENEKLKADLADSVRRVPVPTAPTGPVGLAAEPPPAPEPAPVPRAGVPVPLPTSDRSKVLNFAESLRTLHFGTLSEVNQPIEKKISDEIQNLAAWVARQAEKLA